MANGLVPDITPFAQGVGGFISEQINRRLQEKALAGDQPALARLSSRDPRGASQIGSILRGEQERQEQMRQQEQQILPNISRGFVQAGDKKAFLASTAQLLRQQGMERLAGEVEDDFNRFDANPESVVNEYATAGAIFGTQEALRARKTKDFANGAVLNVLADGSAQITDEQGNTITQGEPGYAEALKRAFDSEVNLAAQKAGTTIEATEGAKRREQIRTEVSSTLRTAPVEIRKLERLEGVFAKADTGGEKAFLASLGRLVPGATGAGLEDALAATNDFVLAAAGRLSGPVSEKELAFLQEVGPRIANSPEGNKLIIQRMIQAFRDDLELAKAQRKWEREGNRPEDFDVEAFIAQKEAERDAQFGVQDLPAPQAQEAPQGQRVGRFVVEVE